MWYLYLDESGDLGFDFVNKKPSRFFTVCILATSQRESFLKIRQAVHITIRRKLNKPKRNKIQELKGTNTTLAVKRYFYQQIKDTTFGLYSITLNKRRVYERLTYEKERVYNFIARKVLEQIPFDRLCENPVFEDFRNCNLLSLLAPIFRKLTFHTACRESEHKSAVSR